MVGVAGRSKGCGTCKKRKVRCDEQRPVCGNCVRAKRECGGYDKPLVFISKGSSDYRKSGLHFRQSPGPSPGLRPHDETVTDSDESSQQAVASPLPLQISEKQTYDVYLLSHFLHAFNPTGFSVLGGQHPWIDRCAQLVDGLDNALAFSLRSLALVRCARTWKDDDLMREGRRTYGRALSKLQAELNHDSTKFSEEVMAACRVLSTYEFLESSSDGIKGWITHMQGMERVVFLRGPSRFKSSLRSGALLDWRASAMIRSIIQRKASFLSVEKWQARGVDVNDLAERLYDQGFILGSLLEKADRAAGGFGALPENDEEFNLYASVGVTKSLSILDQTLDEWYADLSRETSVPYWTVPDYDTVAPLSEGIYSFPDLRTAIFVSTFWTIKLILSDAIQQMCARLLRERDEGASLDMRHSLQLLDQIGSQHHAMYRKTLAVNVVKATPYCLSLGPENPDPPEVLTGLSAAQRCLFTLGMAMRVLFRFELGIEYARGSLLFSYLMPKVNFAQNLHNRFRNVAGAQLPNPHEILQNLRERGELGQPSTSSAEGPVPVVEFTRDGTRSHQNEIRRIEGSMTKMHQQTMS